jgi:hypothetical protein
MNAPDRKFLNLGTCAAAARILGGVAAAGLLAGCMDPIAGTRIDPASPVAAEVARISRSDQDYPSFREIPPKPNDVPPPHIYEARARALVVARDQLALATAPETWTLNNTETFLAKARRDVGPDLGPPENTDTESFAAASRKRATPPPPRR